MKSIVLSFAIGAFLFLALTTESKACVDPHPDSVIVFVNTDSLCNMEIRITNLQLMGGSPNEFCSCGIGELWPDQFEVTYIAFVDSITQEPVEGFDPWDFLDVAGDEWSDVDAQSYDWSGFVSDVNESGLLQDQAVDLIIRGTVEQGWGCSYEGELIYAIQDNFAFGTDEWDADNNELADSHQDMTYLSSVSIFDFHHTVVDPSYFEALDAVLLGIDDLEEIQLEVFPNPASDEFTVLASQPVDNIAVFSMDGRMLQTIQSNKLNTTVTVADLVSGLYVVRVQVGNTIRSSQLLVQ